MISIIIKKIAIHIISRIVQPWRHAQYGFLPGFDKR